MAERLVFMTKAGEPFYEERPVKFKWVAGQALKKKRECAENLVNAAKEQPKLKFVMEVSRAGDELGQQFSAFKLPIRVSRDQKLTTVEVVYQNSKVWENSESGSVSADYSGSAFAAKKRANLHRKEGGNLVSFCIHLDGRQFEFDTEPIDAFYNWLYIKALRQSQNEERVTKLEDAICQEYGVKSLQELAALGDTCCVGFTDVFFNHQGKKGKQYNCQARVLAQYISLRIYQPEKLDSIFPPHEKALSDAEDLRKSFDEYVDFVYSSTRYIKPSPGGQLSFYI
ncbi:MAG: hypothetical protein WHT28_12190 [Fimbriimonadales bacterium]|jgi:hypothetical protein